MGHSAIQERKTSVFNSCATDRNVTLEQISWDCAVAPQRSQPDVHIESALAHTMSEGLEPARLEKQKK